MTVLNRMYTPPGVSWVAAVVPRKPPSTGSLFAAPYGGVTISTRGQAAMSADEDLPRDPTRGGGSGGDDRTITPAAMADDFEARRRFTKRRQRAEREWRDEIRRLFAAGFSIEEISTAAGVRYEDVVQIVRAEVVARPTSRDLRPADAAVATACAARARAASRSPGRWPRQAQRAAALPLLRERRLADARAKIGNVRHGSGNPSSYSRQAPTISRSTTARAYRRTESAGCPSSAASLADISSAFASTVIADVAFDRERLGEQDVRSLGVARLEREEREVGERVRDAPCEVQASVDGQALVEQPPGPFVITAHQREAPE